MGWPEAISNSVEAASWAAGIWAVCWLFVRLYAETEFVQEDECQNEE